MPADPGSWLVIRVALSAVPGLRASWPGHRQAVHAPPRCAGAVSQPAPAPSLKDCRVNGHAVCLPRISVSRTAGPGKRAVGQTGAGGIRVPACGIAGAEMLGKDGAPVAAAGGR
jgi:hypothetical protein